MKVVREDLWLPADMHIVTTNGRLMERMGESLLVMGKGAALQAKMRYPWAPALCAEAILFKADSKGVYGFTTVTDDFGIFQVKVHWRDMARLPIIRRSVVGLTNYADKYPNKTFRMNYPGIGAGGLTRDEVEPLLEALPDNVTICMR